MGKLCVRGCTPWVGLNLRLGPCASQDLAAPFTPPAPRYLISCSERRFRAWNEEPRSRSHRTLVIGCWLGVQWLARGLS
jgi:hypothetical protein